MNVAGCLARLDEAIGAAEALGLDVTEARSIRETRAARLGFAGESYVLALVGGTGVGKSTLLNALAGGEVSTAGVRRPTTSEPVAWLPAARRAELAPVLEWLNVKQTVEHRDNRLGSVAILDLPDLDSIAPEHRARVDETLPRVDAVAWVVDPEKYHDAVLHDAYLRRWLPRLGRQAAILTKADRLPRDDAERLRRDLAATLRREAGTDVTVLLASGRDGETGVTAVREWIAEAAEAKRILAGRLAAEVTTTVGSLAALAGVGDDPERAALLSETDRARILADTTRESLAAVDVAGVRRQALAATRLGARPSGGGPMGIVTSAIYRYSGREAAAADPAGHLRRWRERGNLARAVEPARAALVERLGAVPPAGRPSVAALADASALRDRIGRAVDGAISAVAGQGMNPPRSRLWPLVGIGQTLVAGALLFTVLWFLAIWLLGVRPVATADVPLLGPVPTPALLLVLGLVAGYLLARLLGAHAGLLGRRWGASIAKRLETEIETRLRSDLLAPLEAIESARLRLAGALRGVRDDCRDGSQDSDRR